MYQWLPQTTASPPVKLCHRQPWHFASGFQQQQKDMKHLAMQSSTLVLLNLCVYFQPSSIYFSHTIAGTKATMAMVGHFQPNPEKEIQGNNLQ
jgi:acyl-CoA-binding protein